MIPPSSLIFSNRQALSSSQLQQLSPAQLAYIGDGVYELWIRLGYLWPPRRIQTYHQQVVGQVRAENQAQHLLALLEQLTPMEQELVRRGRNAAGSKPRRLSAETYGQASGFETLLGYLYLTDQCRLQALLQYLDTDSEPSARHQTDSM